MKLKSKKKETEGRKDRKRGDDIWNEAKYESTKTGIEGRDEPREKGNGAKAEKRESKGRKNHNEV